MKNRESQHYKKTLERNSPITHSKIISPKKADSAKIEINMNDSPYELLKIMSDYFGEDYII